MTSMAEHGGKFSLLIFSCKIHHNLITIFPHPHFTGEKSKLQKDQTLSKDI